MNTLSEEQYVRAEKVRKQDLYRSMLDQQIRYNEVKRQNEMKNLKTPFDGKYPSYQRNSMSFQPEEHKYLPPLNYQNRGSDYNHLHSKGTNEEDRTEIYLNNCEEIIRNLRQLKGKKRKYQSPTVAPVDPAKLEAQRHKSPEIQYYPKANYFSSSGSAYNKNASLDPSPKYNKLQSTRINTIDESRLNNEKYRKEAPVKSNRNRKLLDKISHSAEHDLRGSGSRQKEESQSQSPSGIKEEIKIPKKSSKLRHKLFKVVSVGQKQDGIEQQNRDIPEVREQQSNALQEVKAHQLQLTACVVELTKYLKNLNEREKLQETEEKEKRQSEPDKQEKEERVVPSQPQQKQQPQYEKQRQPLPRQQNELSQLKSRVVEALKKVNAKSHDFAKKMSDRGQFRSPSHAELDRAGVKNGRADSSKKQGPKSEELVKLLVTHLNKHDDNSDELNRCLKELHQYLRNQNDEIRQMKSNREENPPNQFSPQPSKKNIKKSPEVKQNKRADLSESQLRENEMKLQEAILKNLKKARMRGNMFKQRVQNYRKQHSFQQPSDKSIPVKLLNPNQPKQKEKATVLEKIQTQIDQKIKQNPSNAENEGNKS